ncbi:helix-turn-helix transcriptional regulator [Leuconostoc falkenbergense]|uniref:helix-turn-helix domain-containing protein n=1 Tax=Leuconostoc falkenbergense TaxID=2766470 RepID=UPI002A81B31A|nr:helix-turn-helix transcriptional regulator [Leuconostoc falkenbergense]MDY5164692.1 helix-turn-helix transcriptional regulator [Leuconostoc falkenbergense]
MINISSEALLELRRIRGERNINVTKLAEETGVSRWTLADILAGRRKFVRKSVYEKLNAWILKNRKTNYVKSQEKQLNVE